MQKESEAIGNSVGSLRWSSSNGRAARFVPRQCVEQRIARPLASLKDNFNARDLVLLTDASSSVSTACIQQCREWLVNKAAIVYDEKRLGTRWHLIEPPHAPARYPPQPPFTKRGKHPVQLSTRRAMFNVTLGFAPSAARDKQSIRCCGFLNNYAVPQRCSATQTRRKTAVQRPAAGRRPRAIAMSGS